MIRWQPGEARTRIVICRAESGTSAGGYATERWTPIYNQPLPCRWVNVHGREAWQAAELKLKEAATLTLRYTPYVDVRCRIWKAGDPQDDKHAFEIVSIDDVREQHRLMEIKVKRLVVA